MSTGDEIRVELIDLVARLSSKTEQRRAAKRPFVAAVPDVREVGCVDSTRSPFGSSATACSAVGESIVHPSR